MIIVVKLLQLLSYLPLGWLYVLSSCCYPLVYYVVRYRRRVVHGNIAHSFPELSLKERKKIERDFYKFFCDYTFETIKLMTMSADEMKRRMVVEGMDEVADTLTRRPFVFIYLGHYCNWEWISSTPLWGNGKENHFAQLYRPLKDQVIDEMFFKLRTRFGAENISKYESLRRIMTLKQQGIPSTIGFISDQSPRPNSIHDWVDFLHQETPVFTGTERIAKKVNAAIYFADVKRIKRGYYHLTYRLVTEDVKSFPDYQITEIYMKDLEKMIRRQPHLWLWSHKRWKHKREDVERLQQQTAKKENTGNE